MFSCYFHVSPPAAVSSQVHHFQVYLAGKNLCDSCIRLHHCDLPQELLHRCVLVVLKLTNRKERLQQLSMSPAFRLKFHSGKAAVQRG